MTEPARDRSRFRRHIAQIWLGQVLSGLGDRLHEVALVWVAVEAVGESAGWVVAAGSVGRLLFGLPGGVLADRWDRQHTMIACDLLCALAVGSLAFVNLDSPHVVWLLAAVAVAVGAFDSLFQPALQASLPALAPDRAGLQAANAWLDITRRLAMALGPSATGLLLAVFPLQQFFALDALTFCLSAIAIRAVGRGYRWKAPGSKAAQRPAMLSEIVGAAREVAGHVTLRFGLIQNALWNIMLTPALTLGMALLVKNEFQAGPALLGYATGAYGVGNVLANLAMTRITPINTARTLHLGALIAGVGWFAVSQTSGVPFLLFVIALTAIGGPVTDLMLLRVIQTEFPADRIGKVFSFRYVMSRTSQAVGLAVAVPIYATFGVRNTIAVSGAILAAYALFALIAAARRASNASAAQHPE